VDRPGSAWASSRAAPVMVWYVSRPGDNGKLQSHMCKCALRQATDVSKDGMTTSSYGAENTPEIRGVPANVYQLIKH